MIRGERFVTTLLLLAMVVQATTFSSVYRNGRSKNERRKNIAKAMLQSFERDIIIDLRMMESELSQMSMLRRLVQRMKAAKARAGSVRHNGKRILSCLSVIPGLLTNPQAHTFATPIKLMKYIYN